MPFANIKIPQAALSRHQKAEIVHRLTSLFAEYFGDAAPSMICAHQPRRRSASTPSMSARRLAVSGGGSGIFRFC